MESREEKTRSKSADNGKSRHLIGSEQLSKLEIRMDEFDWSRAERAGDRYCTQVPK